VAFSCLSGGYPYLRKMRLTMTRIYARTFLPDGPVDRAVVPNGDYELACDRLQRGLAEHRSGSAENPPSLASKDQELQPVVQPERGVGIVFDHPKTLLRQPQPIINACRTCAVASGVPGPLLSNPPELLNETPCCPTHLVPLRCLSRRFRAVCASLHLRLVPAR
jgi:hypothetical protein